jgi:3-oxoadipate enol-lactonase
MRRNFPMPICDLGAIRLHYREDGDPLGAPVVFAHALGTDLRLWDGLIPRLPPGLRLIRLDMRGHGLSDAPAPPYSMGLLIRDAERMLDSLSIRDCVFVGLSIGGMIAQGLAVKRLDLVRAMVLSNTAARIGTADLWQTRIAAVREGGIAAVAEATMERWFTRAFRATPDVTLWRHMLERQPADGWVGAAAAIAGSDFYTTTASLTLPTLAIAGSDDGSTPADLVRETADLIRGSRFHLIRGAGHLPLVEQPEDYADTLTQFLRDIGHL